MSIPNMREITTRRPVASHPTESMPPTSPESNTPDPSDVASTPGPLATLRNRRVLGILVVLLGVASLFAFRSLVGPLVLAAWLAALSQPFMTRATRALGSRYRAALVTTVAIALACAVPLGILGVLLVRAVQGVPEMIRSQAVAGHWISAASEFLQHDGSTPALRLGQLIELGRSVLPTAAAAATQTAQQLGAGAIDLLVLAVGTYYFAAEGPDLYARLRRGSPLSTAHFDTLAEEALSVARALLVGGVLSALLQGTVAAVIYAMLGLTGWPLLATLTAVASMLPVVGSALVWIPLGVGLAMMGHVRDAVILLALGATLISGVDNAVMPFLSRLGARRLHPLTLLVGVLGGLATAGAWGLFLGPLVAALTVTSCRIYLEGTQRE